jgi:hypothetical protein
MSPQSLPAGDTTAAGSLLPGAVNQKTSPRFSFDHARNASAIAVDHLFTAPPAGASASAIPAKQPAQQLRLLGGQPSVLLARVPSKLATAADGPATLLLLLLDCRNRPSLFLLHRSKPSSLFLLHRSKPSSLLQHLSNRPSMLLHRNRPSLFLLLHRSKPSSLLLLLHRSKSLLLDRRLSCLLPLLLLLLLLLLHRKCPLSFLDRKRPSLWLLEISSHLLAADRSSLQRRNGKQLFLSCCVVSHLCVAAKKSQMLKCDTR